MIRSQELVDKLVADLHFHHYMDVYEGDFWGQGNNRRCSPLYDIVSSWGIDPDTSFYHGGTVINDKKINYLYEYIDDVYIDYFFRTYHFKKIIFPKDFCATQITPNGVITPSGDICLNLQNIYDRCTFVNTMATLFTRGGILLTDIFPKKKFLQNYSFYEKVFGQHGLCLQISSEIPFEEEFNAYLEKYHPGKAEIDPQFRMDEVIRYFNFAKDTFYQDLMRWYTPIYAQLSHNFLMDYKFLKDSHMFGDYSIEDLFLIYSLLVDKCQLNEDSLLPSLLFCIDDIEKTILMDFHDFECSNTNYHILDASIQSEDMYLRFTSRKEGQSNAFTFTTISGAIESIQLFDRPPVRSIYRGNTMPLPYLYNHLNLL